MAMLAAKYPHDPIDVITGDWMSEANMTTRAARKTASKTRALPLPRTKR